MDKKVTLKRTDKSIESLEKPADCVAEFLYYNYCYIDKFNDLMRISKYWDRTQRVCKLKEWETSIKKQRNKKDNDENFINLMKEIFQKCRNDDYFKKIRGLIPEKLVERLFAIRSSEAIQLSFGCCVTINGEKIEYYKLNEQKTTVDVGAIYKTFGEFAEVKLTPLSLHEKDTAYLKLLIEALKNNGIKHKVFIITLDDKKLAEAKVENSIGKNYDICVVGKNELLDLSKIS